MSYLIPTEIYIEITKVCTTMKDTARLVSLLSTICISENTEINDNKCVQVILSLWYSQFHKMKGFCPKGVLSHRGFVPEGFCPRGFCPRGFCPRGVLSYTRLIYMWVESEYSSSPTIGTTEYKYRKDDAFLGDGGYFVSLWIQSFVVLG